MILKTYESCNLSIEFNIITKTSTRRTICAYNNKTFVNFDFKLQNKYWVQATTALQNLLKHSFVLLKLIDCENRYERRKTLKSEYLPSLLAQSSLFIYYSHFILKHFSIVYLQAQQNTAMHKKWAALQITLYPSSSQHLSKCNIT